MMNGLNNETIYSLYISIVIAIFIFLVLVLLLHNQTKRKTILYKRINTIANVNKYHSSFKKGSQAKAKKVKIIKSSYLMEKLEEKLALSGIMIKPEEFITIWLFFVILPALIGFLITNSRIAAAGLAIIGGIIPLFYIKHKYSKQLIMFTNQLGDSLTIMSNCLKSGLSLQQSMASIATEMPDPIAKEFGRVIREIKYGSSIEEALNSLVERVQSKDLELMVSAILIQRQVGGNLSEILNNISSTIISRVKIKNDIKVMTATGRLSGIIVGILPIGVSSMLMVLNPEYFQVFFETNLGIGLLILCVIMELTGFFFISKIVKIDY